MIDFTRGGLADIWPDKQSPEIRALSYAIQQMLRDVRQRADESRSYAALDMLPEPVLDYMAMDLRSMYYDQKLDIAKKREIVRNTLKWYMRAGTVSAVTEMVNIVFGSGRIVEWFDKPGAKAGEFWIHTEAILTEYYFRTIHQTIRRVKNTRSHLGGIMTDRRLDQEIHVGLAHVVTPIWVIPCEEINRADLYEYVGIWHSLTPKLVLA